jgi:hypothetical protein
MNPCVAPTNEEAYSMQAMQPFRARVHNGRLVLDEPTALPEGEVIELVPAPSSSDDRADERAYLVAPPGPTEFSSEEDLLGWEGDGWEEFYASR